MRFHACGPAIPSELVHDVDNGHVVFFCGAGVSQEAASLPSFYGLVERVIELIGVPEADANAIRSVVTAADESDANLPFELQRGVPADRLFSYLEREFPHRLVERKVAEALAVEDADLSAHRNLLDLSRTADGAAQIITTNFDRLFEEADPAVDVWVGPRIPAGARYDPLRGIVKLHGSLNAKGDGAEAPGFVLSTPSFGEAYLASGWAARFIQRVVANHPVVFIGYTADDPLVQYLLEALARRPSKGRLFAFQRSGKNAEEKWRSKRVEPLLFGSFRDLWRTIDEWANRRRDVAAWQRQVISRAHSDPETLVPHQRGQVAELVSFTEGANAFADAEPAPHPGWLRVFDANERYATPEHDPRSPDVVTYDPHDELRLDDDPPVPQANMDRVARARHPPEDAWDALEANPDEMQRQPAFSGNIGKPSLDARRRALARWIARSANHPIALWWATRRRVLHPFVREAIEREATRDGGVLSDDDTLAWHRFFEMQEADGGSDYAEVRFWGVVKRIGWRHETLREFQRLSMPRFVPIYSRPSERPPASDTALLSLVGRRLDSRSAFFRLDVPDEQLPEAVRILCEHLYWMSIHSDVPAALQHFEMPSFNPTEDEDDLHSAEGIGAAVFAITSKLARLHDLHPERFCQLVARWPSISVPFSKLRVWLVAQSFIDPRFAASLIAEICDDAFWNEYQQRDLMLAVFERWEALAPDAQASFIDRILDGAKLDSDDKKYRVHRALCRLQWLCDQCVSLTDKQIARFDILAAETPDWSPEHARYAVEPMGIRGGYVATDDDPSMLNDVPLEDIVAFAQANSGATDKITVSANPFLGLVRSDPERALASLVAANASAEDRMAAWEDMLDYGLWPKWVPEFRQRVLDEVHDQLGSLSANVLLQAAGRLADGLRADGGTLDFECNSGLIDALIERNTALQPHSTIAAASKRSFNAVRFGGLNSLSGVLTQLLILDPAVPKQADGFGLPEHFKARAARLLELPEPLDEYVLVEFGRQLPFLNAQDPKWVEANLIAPMEQPRTTVALLAGCGVGFPREHFHRLKPILLSETSLARSDRTLGDQFLAGSLLNAWAQAAFGDDLLLADSEFRDVLAETDQDIRIEVLQILGRWLGSDQASAETLRGEIPGFFRRVWPRQTKTRSPRLTEPLLNILARSGSDFQQSAREIQQHLEPLSVTQDVWRVDWAERLEVRENASEFLDLLESVLPSDDTLWPIGVRETVYRIRALI